MTIHFAPKAEEDFATIIRYLAERDPATAADFGQRIFDILDKLAGAEFEGPEQTLVSGESVRSWPVPPIRIFYQRRADAFWVLRIYHQARPAITK